MRGTNHLMRLLLWQTLTSSVCWYNSSKEWFQSNGITLKHIWSFSSILIHSLSAPPTVKPILSLLRAIFALYRLQSDIAFFCGEGFMSWVQAKAIKRTLSHLLSVFAPHALKVAESFGIPGFVLLFLLKTNPQRMLTSSSSSPKNPCWQLLSLMTGSAWTSSQQFHSPRPSPPSSEPSITALQLVLFFCSPSSSRFQQRQASF